MSCFGILFLSLSASRFESANGTDDRDWNDEKMCLVVPLHKLGDEFRN